MSERTLPAIAFVFPYHEMLLRGLLNVDGFGVKTRSSNWSFRGPILLYTSNGRYHQVPAIAHNLNPNEFPRGVIVGVATLVDVKVLNNYERVKMLQNFNRVDFETAKHLAEIGVDYIEPLPFGLFLKNIKRFKKPVSFKPRQGAIGIMRVPLTQVSKALKEVGINPKTL